MSQSQNTRRLAVAGTASILLTVLSAGLTSLPAAAITPTVTIQVTSTTDAVDPTPNDGVCDTTLAHPIGTPAPCSLRAAVQTAGGTLDINKHVVIKVPKGLYKLTISDTSGTDDESGGDLGVNSNVDIIGNGTGLANPTIIEGATQAGDRVFETGCDTGPITLTPPPAVRVSISGVVIRSGSAVSFTGAGDDVPLLGGGIHNCQDLVLDNVVVSGNQAFVGGGIFSSSNPFVPPPAAVPHVTITNSTLKDNLSLAGGGIWTQDGPVTMLNSRVLDNLAFAFAGGIYNSNNHFTITDSRVRFNGATVSNSTSFGGGGIVNGGGQLDLLRSDVSQNVTFGLGGGIYATGGLVNVTESLVQDNSSDAGGGGIETGSASLAVTDSTIRRNATKGNGGGLENHCAASLNRDTFYGNLADNGGGIADSGSASQCPAPPPPPTAAALVSPAANAHFAKDLAAGSALLTAWHASCAGVLGGGDEGPSAADRSACGKGIGGAPISVGRVSSADGSDGRATTAIAVGPPPGASLLNSTITGNHAVPNEAPDPTEGHGGGIYNQNVVTTVNFTTIAGNSAATASDNISQQSTNKVAPGELHLASTIVSGGKTNCDAVVISLGHNLDSADTCGFDTKGDIINSDPMLGKLANNGGPTKTEALLVGSPAIDHAAKCPPPNTDQRGIKRKQGPKCDIGAFEVVFVPPPTPSPTPSPAASQQPVATPSPVPTPKLPTAGFQPSQAPSVLELLWPLLVGVGAVWAVALTRRARL